MAQTPQKKVTQKTNVPPPPPPVLDSKQNIKKGKVVQGKDGVYVVVEKQPEFPGGYKALLNYLSNDIKYPKAAIENNIQGRVVTQFVVEKDGSISDIIIVKESDPTLNEEAIRVVKAMPNWKLGLHKGQAVRVRHTLPIVFKLQGDKKEKAK